MSSSFQRHPPTARAHQHIPICLFSRVVFGFAIELNPLPVTTCRRNIPSPANHPRIQHLRSLHLQKGYARKQTMVVAALAAPVISAVNKAAAAAAVESECGQLRSSKSPCFKVPSGACSFGTDKFACNGLSPYCTHGTPNHDACRPSPTIPSFDCVP